LSESRIGRGSVCWATVPAGFGHDQGTRPWLVLSPLSAGLERAIAAPISSATSGVDLYPITWSVPPRWGLDRPSWVRVDHLRSLPVARLRDPFVEASRDELDEVVQAIGALLGATITWR
jgi:mRNA-degrading endonuclease toxin of MazEF toxin-antitoxin module